MNHGYYPLPEDPELALDEETRPWKHQARMYHDLVSRGLGGRPPDGLRLLDVGCGRGGGAAYLARDFGFDRIVGLEVSVRQVEFCAGRHARIERLSFIGGSALRLPFQDRSFDAVTNVESLHCYPDARRFFDEARRVLRSGGVFLCADIFEGPPSPDVLDAMSERFEPVASRDITRQVALACLADSARFSRVLEDRVRPETLQYLVHLFRAKFLLYHHRQHTYHQFVLRRV